MKKENSYYGMDYHASRQKLREIAKKENRVPMPHNRQPGVKMHDLGLRKTRRIWHERMRRRAIEYNRKVDEEREC